MDKPTAMITDLIKARHIKLKGLAEEVNIPYDSLYRSLGNSKKRKRTLRGDELIKLCDVLKIDPFSLLDE